MSDFNYKYYEHQAEIAFVTADETRNNARAQLFLLDSIARSLACLADVHEQINLMDDPKPVDFDIGTVKEETENDND